MLEIIDDRAANKATIITSQLPIEHWHAWVGDATIADAILDRVMQRNHRFNLMGESLRSGTKSATSSKAQNAHKPARVEQTKDTIRATSSAITPAVDN